jgi:hypothetical protein
MAAVCPWCQAPRDSGLNCPKCGADYAKAEAIKSGGKAKVAAAPPAAVQVGDADAMIRLLAAEGGAEVEGGVEDKEMEWKLCAGALPAMLALALLFNYWEMGHFLQRTALTMPVHEMGHASVAWLCGYMAIPTLWRTHVPDTRGFLAPLLLMGGMGWLAWRAWRAENLPLTGLCGAVIALALVGTLLLKPATTKMLITFGGDGMGMVLAVVLMSSFYFGKGTQLYTGSLRWGFMAMGAAAYVDIFAVWAGARRDYGKIPFGEMEGTGTSDATRLVDDFGWSPDQLVQRYFTLGLCCLAATVAVYAWGVWRARKEAAKV